MVVAMHKKKVAIEPLIRSLLKHYGNGLLIKHTVILKHFSIKE